MKKKKILILYQINGLELLKNFINDAKKPVQQKNSLFEKIKKFFEFNTSKVLNDNLDLILDSIVDYEGFIDIFFENEEFEKSPEIIIKIYDKIKQEFFRIYAENEEELNKDEETITIENVDRMAYKNRLKEILSYCEIAISSITDKYLDMMENTKSEKENIYKLFEMVTGDNLRIPLVFSVIEKAKGKYPELDKKMNIVLKDNKKDFAKFLIHKRNIIVPYLKIKRNEEKYNDFLSMMIDELLDDEKKEYIDIENIGGGSYADAYRIGDKILKIGRHRRTNEIPYNRRILQPLYRRIMDEDDDLFIEVSERVKTFNLEEDHTEEVYKVFKELMDNGIAWLDPSPANIGILLKDNNAFLHDETIEVDPIASSMEPSEEREVLKKGEIVILDTDYLFRNDDERIAKLKTDKWPIQSIYYKERYDKEKKEETFKNSKIVENFHDQKSDEFFADEQGQRRYIVPAQTIGQATVDTPVEQKQEAQRIGKSDMRELQVDDKKSNKSFPEGHDK